MTIVDPNNFSFEIGNVSYKMVDGKLTSVKNENEILSVTTEFGREEDGRDDDVYLLARAYAGMLYGGLR